MMLVTSFSGN